VNLLLFFNKYSKIIIKANAPYQLLPSTLNKRGPGFGYGNKEILTLD
jgi:hypothetical protein